MDEELPAFREMAYRPLSHGVRLLNCLKLPLGAAQFVLVLKLCALDSQLESPNNQTLSSSVDTLAKASEAFTDFQGSLIVRFLESLPCTCS